MLGGEVAACLGHAATSPPCHSRKIVIPNESRKAGGMRNLLAIFATQKNNLSLRLNSQDGGEIRNLQNLSVIIYADTSLFIKTQLSK
jgi:hypothetical protein